MQDLMNRTVHNMMSGTCQDNKDLVIISKNIAPVEILDGEIEPQVKNHLLLTLRRRIVDHAHQKGPGLEDTDIQGVKGRGPAGGRDLNVEEGTLLKRRKDHGQNEEMVTIDHLRIKGGGIPPLHQKRGNLKVMRKSGTKPELPNQFKQRQRNLKT